MTDDDRAALRAFARWWFGIWGAFWCTWIGVALYLWWPVP
jgi:hypothetical protein